MPDQVVVYIDAQNTYKGARSAFYPGQTPHFAAGQIDPLALGTLLLRRTPAGFNRELKQVRIYTGRPDATKQPQTYWPHMRQCAAWESAGARVVWKPLRYPPDFPVSKPEEKGVDVQLAVDLVTHAMSRRFDVGIVFSTDTDLRPAIEWVARRAGPLPRVELAAWRSSTSNSAIPVDAPRRTWCHWLYDADYRSIHDRTDYTAP